MEAAFVIAFREGMEAFLVLGIILAFLEKMALSHYKKYAWTGLLSGIVVSFVLAVIFTVVIDGFESEDLQYNLSLVVLFFAIVLLSYMVFWMQHNAEIANLKRRMELSVNQRWISFLIVFTAILREGLETVLFSLALILDGETTPQEVMIGLCVGLIVSAVVIWMLFKTSIKLPIKTFFAYSSYLILLIVAGLVSLFVKGLQAYQYLPIFIDPVYDSGSIISNESVLGRFLSILIGYDAQPSLLQLSAWFLYIIALLSLISWRRHSC